MTTPQIALLSLALGAVIGAGLAAVVLWAFRTRRRAAEESQAVVPDGTAAVLAGMEDAACVVDASGLVLAVSSAALRFGIQPGATLDDHELRLLVRGVHAGGGAETASMRLTPPGLSLDPRLVSARASALGPRLTLLVIRDVTEHERLEQVRRDFVSNTSHELKTPVGAVSLLAEAIESAADDPEQVRVFAARISAEADRLARLTSRIMSLSRLQAADGLADFGAVAVDEVLAASLEAHTVQADSAGVELVRGGDRAAFVRGDAQILIEAVSNLVANAIAYSPRGSRVGVGVRVDEDAVEIAVSDRGIGISEADRDRIFERFYRADDARSRRTGGTGLGLSIVKHATQRHGGEVKVWSRPGHGSTFTMRLPRIDVPAPEEPESRIRKRRARRPVRSDAARARNGDTP